jgi:hypothetical protein
MVASMISAENLGYASTAGVEARIYPVVPPKQFFHQDGIVDTVLVAYDEPETNDMIVVGRVITSPEDLEWSDGDNSRSFKTSTVRGLAGDAVIFQEYNEPLKRWAVDKQAENLVKMQEAAAAMVLGHFGYEVKKRKASNVFARLLKKVS